MERRRYDVLLGNLMKLVHSPFIPADFVIVLLIMKSMLKIIFNIYGIEQCLKIRRVIM
jgi:hypothetical protein